MQINIKKLRFVIISLFLLGMAYAFASNYSREDQLDSSYLLIIYVVILTVISVLSSIFVQYLDGGQQAVKNFFFLGFTPLLLVLGCFLFFVYYPNLSLVLKLGAFAFYSFLLYTLLLLNNVVLVVESREVNIPVYRVALNWVQIVLLSISIPLFTGIFRLNIQPLLQTVVVILSTYVLCNYLIWVYSYEKEIRALKFYESLVLTGSFSLLTGWGAFTTLFVPAESFLRGLFVSSLFLLGLGYIQLYLKNSLSKKNIRDYQIICFTFLFILLLFRP